MSRAETESIENAARPHVAEFSGRWVNADGNELSVRSAGGGKFAARFVRKDGKRSWFRRFLARFGRPAFGMYGCVRQGALEIEIGQNRAVRLTLQRVADGDQLVPEILRWPFEDADQRSVPPIAWLEPLTPFRRSN